MSKRSLAGIACLGTIWFVSANVQRLLAEDVHYGSSSGDQVAEPQHEDEDDPFGGFSGNQVAEGQEEDDPFGGRAGRGGEMGRGGSKMPMGGAMGMGRGGSNRNALAMAAARERLREESVGLSRPGTFSVVSDGKRSILLNTSTGASWTLVIDEQGSHWAKIRTNVDVVGRERNEADQVTMASSLLDEYEKQLKERAEALAHLDRKASTLTEQLRVRSVEMDELKKQLEEAQEALSARDKDAHADVVDASKVE